MRFNPYQNPFNNYRNVSLGKMILDFLKKRDIISRIVLVLLISYLSFLLVWLYMYLFSIPLKYGETDFKFFVKYVSIPKNIEGFLQMPWTLFTHLIINTSFFQLLLTIVVLTLFGKLFFQFWNGGRFVFLLFFSGIIGVLFFIYSHQLFPNLFLNKPDSMLVGTLASVFGLIVYMLIYMPEHRFVYMMIIRIKMKHIIIAVLLIDIMFIRNETPAVYFAHIGGAFGGALFALLSKLFQKASFNMPKWKISKKEDIIENVNELSDEEYNLLRKQKQDRMNIILEKISESGYGSLTKEEKEFLFRESRR